MSRDHILGSQHETFAPMRRAQSGLEVDPLYKLLGSTVAPAPAVHVLDPSNFNDWVLAANRYKAFYGKDDVAGLAAFMTWNKAAPVQRYSDSACRGYWGGYLQETAPASRAVYEQGAKNALLSGEEVHTALEHYYRRTPDIKRFISCDIGNDNDDLTTIVTRGSNQLVTDDATGRLTLNTDCAGVLSYSDAQKAERIALGGSGIAMRWRDDLPPIDGKYAVKFLRYSVTRPDNKIWIYEFKDGAFRRKSDGEPFWNAKVVWYGPENLAELPKLIELAKDDTAKNDIAMCWRTDSPPVEGRYAVQYVGRDGVQLNPLIVHQLEFKEGKFRSQIDGAPLRNSRAWWGPVNLADIPKLDQIAKEGKDIYRFNNKADARRCWRYDMPVVNGEYTCENYDDTLLFVDGEWRDHYGTFLHDDDNCIGWWGPACDAPNIDGWYEFNTTTECALRFKKAIETGYVGIKDKQGNVYLERKPIVVDNAVAWRYSTTARRYSK